MMKIPGHKLIVTADDFGISPGVNQAIIDSHIHGALTNASLLVSGKYFTDAVNLAKEKAPQLKLGLHINLTSGKPVLPAAQLPNLVDKAGNFKYGPVALLVMTIIKPAILNEIKYEIESQINKLTESGVKISHMDGHHHVQMIPGIFPLVLKLAEKYEISRVRVVNESLLHSIYKTKHLSFLINGGIARYALLKAMCIFNNYKTGTYFFSILNSCRITSNLIKNIAIPDGYDAIEIMLHPGNEKIDQEADTGEIGEKLHLTSKYRSAELQTALDLKLYQSV
jgi:predicted glycoside hydrolase/deacetylase ChbG (UPF0249 family)